MKTEFQKKKEAKEKAMKALQRTKARFGVRDPLSLLGEPLKAR